MSHYNLFMNNKHQGFFNLTEKEQEKLKKENAQWAMDYQIFLYRNICSLKNMNF